MKKIIKLKLGFTLIELLGVLILLAVIALITIPIIDKVLSNAKNEAYERQKENIIEAARLYVTTNGKYSTSQTQLSFETLIDAGLLKDGEILDPRDSNKEMPGCVIYNWDESKNQYIFEYSENCIVFTPAECFTYVDTTVIDSFSINYDECVTFFSKEEFTTDEAKKICNGQKVFIDELGLTFEEYVDFLVSVDSYEVFEPLLLNNVIELIENNGVEITRYDNVCGGEDVILPKSINGKDIVSIGKYSFAGSGVTFNNKSNYYYVQKPAEPAITFKINSIDMSNATKLKYVKDQAFSYAQLKSVKFSDSVISIGNHVFYGNELTNIIIPNNVMIIGSYAFNKNQLSNLTIGNSVISIEDSAFSQNQLTSVVVPNSVITIGYSAFSQNQLSNLTIGNSVTEIGSYAFSDNQLSSLDLSNLTNLKSIESTSFRCNLITAESFVGINEYNYDFFDFGCSDM